jgi:hypothetical protein
MTFTARLGYAAAGSACASACCAGDNAASASATPTITGGTRGENFDGIDRPQGAANSDPPR